MPEGYRLILRRTTPQPIDNIRFTRSQPELDPGDERPFPADAFKA